jgi:hypothetical protein
MNQLSHARGCLTPPTFTPPLASGLTGTKITLITVATAIPAAALLTLAASARAPRCRTATAHA